MTTQRICNEIIELKNAKTSALWGFFDREKDNLELCHLKFIKDNVFETRDQQDSWFIIVCDYLGNDCGNERIKLDDFQMFRGGRYYDQIGMSWCELKYVTDEEKKAFFHHVYPDGDHDFATAKEILDGDADLECQESWFMSYPFGYSEELDMYLHSVFIRDGNYIMVYEGFNNRYENLERQLYCRKLFAETTLLTEEEKKNCLKIADAEIAKSKVEAQVLDSLKRRDYLQLDELLENKSSQMSYMLFYKVYNLLPKTNEEEDMITTFITGYLKGDGEKLYARHLLTFKNTYNFNILINYWYECDHVTDDERWELFTQIDIFNIHKFKKMGAIWDEREENPQCHEELYYNSPFGFSFALDLELYHFFINHERFDVVSHGLSMHSEDERIEYLTELGKSVRLTKYQKSTLYTRISTSDKLLI